MHTKVYNLLSDFNKIKWKLTFKGILIGIIVGLLTVLYRMGIEFGTETAVRIYSYLKLHPGFAFLWTVIIMSVGLFIGWLVKLEPMASGSGIPQTEGVLLYGLNMKWYSILAVRYLGGILCSIFGLSLGREGPSIQIGAAGGQLVANRISTSHLEDKYLITGGAAAGLSAAFNAPLSGIVFALEEVHRSFSPLVLLAATTASLTADFVSKNFFGLKPVLNFTATPQLPINLYIWLIPIGIVSGFAGSLMNKLLLGFQSLYRKIPAILRPCIALLIALPCGIFLPEILGGGQKLIRISENAGRGIGILFVFLFMKMIFTGTSFGSGVPGGIFFPILSVGALTGGILGIAATYLGLPSKYIADFVVCAMTGVLSASVKAPVTSILLTFEMSGSLIHLLPVAACSFIALLISDVLKTQPIYEALLERFIENNGSKITIDEKGGLHEFVVELGSEVCDKMIGELNWPQGSLVVGIRRGAREIVPKGNTQIRPGDYLVILSPEGQDQEIRKYMTDYCYCGGAYAVSDKT
ncbi:MAG: chloride channel protein [Firmicutes bacterium]|nr:chloride channel protein [Bacillota bacterium]